MKKNCTQLLYVLVGIIAPLFVRAQIETSPGTGWVTCNGPDCDFAKLIEMVVRVMRNLYIIGFSVAILFFAYAGYLVLTSGANAGKRQQAKGIFFYVVIGFIVMFFSYGFVVYVLKSLGVSQSFFQLLQFN